MKYFDLREKVNDILYIGNSYKEIKTNREIRKSILALLTEEKIIDCIPETELDELIDVIYTIDPYYKDNNDNKKDIPIGYDFNLLEAKNKTMDLFLKYSDYRCCLLKADDDFQIYNRKHGNLSDILPILSPNTISEYIKSLFIVDDDYYGMRNVINNIFFDICFQYAIESTSANSIYRCIEEYFEKKSELDQLVKIIYELTKRKIEPYYCEILSYGRDVNKLSRDEKQDSKNPYKKHL